MTEGNPNGESERTARHFTAGCPQFRADSQTAPLRVAGAGT
ncbi:hypothetical protein AB0346_00745 [Nocardia beijingensis]